MSSAKLPFVGLFAALSTCATCVPIAAHAYEVKRTDAGSLVHWSQTTVRWEISASVRKVKGGEAAAAEALEAWSGRGGAPDLVVTRTRAKLEPGFDGRNAIFYAPDGFAAAGNALAVTILTFDERTGEILDADIVLNGKYRFASSDPDADDHDHDQITYDLSRVLAHEVGHALGLADEPRLEEALMYPVAWRGTRGTPAADDLDGVRSIYLDHEVGAELEPSGCEIVTRSRESTGPGAIALGIVTLAFRARRRRGRRGDHASGTVSR